MSDSPDLETPHGPSDSPADSEFPVAVPREGRSSQPRRWKHLGTRLWWLTAVCAVTALVLVGSSLLHREAEITVRFREGYGIKPGDALRYRGIDVGQVTDVQLSEDLDRVTVVMSLEEKAAGVAREGSQFWIRRPQISLSRMSGLDTVVGAHYIEVLPGPLEGKQVTTFDGLETPPTLAQSKPTEITIRFPSGHGLSVGDVLKHRGIDVGEVRDVRLQDDLRGVEVSLQLVASAGRLARAGSQFWIERPQVSVTQVRGLDTVVSGRHIAVLPGPESASVQTEFLGLDTAPAVTDRVEGGLEILLEAEDRNGLTAGAPLAYRGMQVGQITSLGLTSDARTVEVRAYVRPEFRQLVRNNSRFWTVSGVGFHLGLTGLRMDVESLSTLAAGGVAVATPDPPGNTVATGHRFTLHVDAEEDWRQWQPSIPVSNAQLPGNITLAAPIRLSLQWQPRTLGIPRHRQRDAWVLPLVGGHVLGPADILSPAEEIQNNQPVVSLAGKATPLAKGAAKRFGLLALYSPKVSLGAAVLFPTKNLRVPPRNPEHCMVVGDPLGRQVPVAASRLTRNQNTWHVDPMISLDDSWHGAAVVSRKNGTVIGVLCVADGKSVIAPLTKELVASL